MPECMIAYYFTMTITVSFVCYVIWMKGFEPKFYKIRNLNEKMEDFMNWDIVEFTLFIMLVDALPPWYASRNICSADEEFIMLKLTIN